VKPTTPIATGLQATGVKVLILGSNGNQFEVSHIAHFAFNGNGLFIHPTATNDPNVNYGALLTEFNKLFKAGTTLTFGWASLGGGISFPPGFGPAGFMGGINWAAGSAYRHLLRIQTGYFDTEFDMTSLNVTRFLVSSNETAAAVLHSVSSLHAPRAPTSGSETAPTSSLNLTCENRCGFLGFL
jgi:hypothetical protein